jgi:hypothetical protein
MRKKSMGTPVFELLECDQRIDRLLAISEASLVFVYFGELARSEAVENEGGHAHQVLVMLVVWVTPYEGQKQFFGVGV